MSQASKRMVCDKRISYRVLRRQTGTNIRLRGFLFLHFPSFVPEQVCGTAHLHPHQLHFDCSQQQIPSDRQTGLLLLWPFRCFPLFHDSFCLFVCFFFFFYLCCLFSSLPALAISFFLYASNISTYIRAPSLHVHWYIQGCVNRYSWKREMAWRGEQSASVICKCKYHWLLYSQYIIFRWANLIYKLNPSFFCRNLKYA